YFHVSLLKWENLLIVLGACLTGCHHTAKEESCFEMCCASCFSRGTHVSFSTASVVRKDGPLMEITINSFAPGQRTVVAAAFTSAFQSPKERQTPSSS